MAAKIRPCFFVVLCCFVFVLDDLRERQGLQISVVIFFLPRCDDRDDRQILHASFFFPLNQVHKDRVLYSVDKNLETKGDSRNFCDEQILKCGRHVCRHCVISRAT